MTRPEGCGQQEGWAAVFSHREGICKGIQSGKNMKEDEDMTADREDLSTGEE